MQPIKRHHYLLSPILVSLALSVQAAPKGANLKTSQATSPAVQALHDLRTARALAKYGESRKDALALIVAARMAMGMDEQALSLERKGGPGTAVATSPSGPSESPAVAWLARAKAIAFDRADLIALADDVGSGKLRGSGIRSPRIAKTVIKAGSTDQFTIRYEGGEPAAVAISVDEGIRLRLYVLDENGNQVCVNVDQEPDILCRWTPRWTGPFTIRVVNQGPETEYTIRSN